MASALAGVARFLATLKDLPAVVSGVCHLAVETISSCDHADVMTIAPGGVVVVPAASDWVGLRIVSIEDEYDEGPCLDAVRFGEVTHAPDLNTEQRWPRFVPKCLAETPVRAGMGLPLLVGDKAIGALDLYANQPQAFHPEDLVAAVLFSVHAAVAFEAAAERMELQKAIATRDLIGQAKGILMAQSNITADEAFDLLRRASQRLNQKLVVVAQDIVQKTTAT